VEVTMFRSYRHTAFILPFVVSTIFAGPKIEFESKTFNSGIALEGKTEKIKASFIVKNVGDSVLKLENVRPGCGCTVVKYDTLIQPGKTVKIESEVNIKGYHSGKISKGITVTSNARNEPTVHLTIEATIQSIIDISETYLTFEVTNNSVPKSVFLSSKKTDLKVTEVSFKSGANPGAPDWQSDLPLTIIHKWLPTDSTRSDGYRVYKLDLFAPETGKSASGEFIIKTNHPDKPEISLHGAINK
jgi:hypothetical protein